jgi:hypothetical protein
MKCSLDSTASPQQQRFVSTALMLCRCPFSGVMPMRSYARMLACLLLRLSYTRRVWLPSQAASTLRTDSPNVADTCEASRLKRS